MKLTYVFQNLKKTYEVNKNDEATKLNYVLSNNKGDFINLGVDENSNKNQGFLINDNKTLEIFKVIDELSIKGLEVDEVEFNGFTFKRKFKSSLIVTEDENNESEIIANDSIYLSHNGGISYEIEGFDGDMFLDLDCRKRDDFHEWGRNYSINEKNGIIIIQYEKKLEESTDYKIYLAIKGCDYEKVEKWVEKEYKYSKRRNSTHDIYVFRALKFKLKMKTKIIFGAGFTENEAIGNLEIIDTENSSILTYDNFMYDEITKTPSFQNPLNEDAQIAYKLSSNAVYRFYNRDIKNEKVKGGFYAGFPWFSDIWARDEIISLKSFIDKNESTIVKEKIFEYLEKIDVETGTFKRIEKEGSLQSADGIFWISKRIEDLIFHLDKVKRLNTLMKKKDLEYMYKKLSNSFNKIIKNNWNKGEQLLKVNNGDPWMDTINVNFPLDMQVLLLQMISTLALLSNMIGLKDEEKRLIDLEDDFREKIRERYMRNSNLYDEPNGNRLSSNIFLACYIYRDLFIQSDWEIIFDNALNTLLTNWGGIRSLSKKDFYYEDDYTGENNKSYHNGDSWYWTNNITAIVLSRINEKKYRKVISDIVKSSTEDILKLGTIGFASELSSASSQKAEGSLAQLWSSATYLEMIDELYKRNN